MTKNSPQPVNKVSYWTSKVSGVCFGLADRVVLMVMSLLQTQLLSAVRSYIQFGHLRIRFSNGLQLEQRAASSHQLYSSQPVTLMIHHPAKMLLRMLLDVKLGFSESYMYSEWDCTPNVQALVSLMLKNEEAARKAQQDRNVVLRVLFIVAQQIGRVFNYTLHWLHSNTIAGSASNIHEHYDVGNDFFGLFLDEDMNYSSGYFNSPDESLAQAQSNKQNMVLDKLRVPENGRILEIGCGWGALAITGARERHLNWTGVTISAEQIAFAHARLRQLNLMNRVNLQLMDYRETKGEYDGIVSLEMLEHVGHEFMPGYFRIVKDRLILGGRAVLQVMTWPNATYDKYRRSSDFFKKHLSPGLNLPSISAVTGALPEGLELHELQSMGTHYAPTLEKWIVKMEANHDRIVGEMGYPETFYRLWHFFLTSCVPMFAEHHVDVTQFVFVKTRQ